MYRNYIYGLTDPRTGQVFYVGRTNEPARRFIDHSASHNLEVKAIYQELSQCGLQPEMKILETVDGNGVETRERYWVAWHLKQGASLCNRALVYNNVGRRLSIEEVENGASWDRLDVQVRPDQKQRIIEMAKQQGRNKSEVVRELLDLALGN